MTSSIVSESHRRRGGCSASRSLSPAWQPLELELSLPAPPEEEALPPPTALITTPLRSDRHAGDDDTVSLLSDSSPMFRRGRRRRGGRRRPVVRTPSSSSDTRPGFPVHGCASLLLSLMVAAVLFTMPKPVDQTLTQVEVVLPCCRQLWQQLGYLPVHEKDGDMVAGVVPAESVPVAKDEDGTNPTVTFSSKNQHEQHLGWTWFVEQVNDVAQIDRCPPSTSDNHSNTTRTQAPCTCRNPTRPWGPPETTTTDMVREDEVVVVEDDDEHEYWQQWESTVVEHQKRVKQQDETLLPYGTDVELVFIGDAAMEHWMGTSLGRPHASYTEQAQIYETALRDNHETRPYIHTTSYGIAGDRCGQVLHRIQNNAVVPMERIGIQTVFWLWIGVNDVIQDSCGADQVSAGIFVIVQELRAQRPDAWIVVQSLVVPPPSSSQATVVNAINQATRCLVDSAPHSFYYNSSRVFSPLAVEEDANTTASHFFAEKEDAGIHPNAEASQKWAFDMLDFVRMLYKDRYNL